MSFDTIPIGGTTAFGRHGLMLVVCGKGASSITGRLHYRIMAFGELKDGYMGSAVAAAVLAMLEQRPWHFTVSELKRIFLTISGDGAVVLGGPQRTSSSIGAAEKIWLKLHLRFLAGAPLFDVSDATTLGDICHWSAALAAIEENTLHFLKAQRQHDSAFLLGTRWDLYHRENIKVMRAREASEMAEDMFSTARALDAGFHLGEGRLLLKAAADYAGSKIY